uniref:Apple domain-containing protein n=1 Tax=Globisporangium ultimum (strain ATCC 200006 / CBS 805.95 / DAOM BR144) TaxID=431595 RepID=K3WFA4_GLOUD
METNVDYYGNDIGSVSHVSPEQCCAACTATPGCNYFTFVNLDPQGPTCYMKSAKGTSIRNIGALSGRVIRQATPSPAPVCTIANGEHCGNAQASLCCSSNNYCQPWDNNYYQCVGVPQGCGEFETDTDVIGMDIGSISNIQPWDCCTRCRENPACNYFSFVNTDPQGPTCYMKSSKTSSIRKVGVVSGRAITKP